MKTLDYFAAIKTLRGISSDYALAKALGVSPQAIHKYLHRGDIPGPLIAFKMAELLDQPPARVIANLELERAERSGKTGAANDWSALLSRFGGVLMALCVGAAITGPGSAKASTGAGSSGGQLSGIYIVDELKTPDSVAQTTRPASTARTTAHTPTTVRTQFGAEPCGMPARR